MSANVEVNQGDLPIDKPLNKSGHRISHLLITVVVDVFDAEGRKCNIQDTGTAPLLMCEAEIPPGLYEWLRGKRMPV